MLASLRIENIVLIEKLTIEFKQGLCALTGETGAGKSILLDSLGLATGMRADSGLVRKGAEQANVTAVFEIAANHPAKNILSEQGLAFDQTLILRRTLNSDGRSRAFINDQPVSATLLKSIGESVLEVHGQFDTQGLLDPKTHRQMLDDYAGISTSSSLHGSVRAIQKTEMDHTDKPCDDDKSISDFWYVWKKEDEKLETLKHDVESSRAEEDYLRTALEDLDTLEPQQGEEEKLATLRDSLMHREQVMEGLNQAYHALNTEDDPIRAAWSVVNRIADKLGEQGNAVIEALDRASAEMQEAVSAIQSLSADLEHSEHDLQSIDDRLHELRGQARKHDCDVDDLPNIREDLAQKLNAIEHADDRLAAQIKAVEAAKAAYIKEALNLREHRKTTAQKLDALVQKELPPLKLDKARFVTTLTELDESEWGIHGMDRVRFLVATNPGAEPGPLNKIASGGEMSRFMLALKVVMAEVGSAGALVFDEVDAGIGGGTADAVGERLARLAKDRQILVVTHSPQVAARAAHHYIVQKDGGETLTTSVIPLESEQHRREEIARMLAGATISEEARAAADKLLETGKAA